MTQYDAVVVGGGPAGITAATWLARYRRRTLLVDSGEHRNRWVEQSHGYLTRDPASPRDLLRIACEQLATYPLVTRVAHAEWGTGQILRYEDDKVVVLFDTVGYKTLSVPAVISRGLLQAG